MTFADLLRLSLVPSRALDTAFRLFSANLRYHFDCEISLLTSQPFSRRPPPSERSGFLEADPELTGFGY